MSEVRISSRRALLPLKSVFRIAHGPQHTTNSVIWSITAEGITGYGEGRGGGKLEQVEAALAAIRAEDANPADPPLDLEQIPNPAARSAVDMAFLDWRGKRADLPAHALLGLPRAGIATSITVWLEDPENMVAHAVRLIRAGWPILKVKGGTGQDATVLRRLREAIGPEPRLWVDANESWTLDEALDFVEATRDLGIELIEQPLKSRSWEELRRLRGEAGPPIFLDEDVHGLRDVVRAAQEEAAEGVNIKLGKCGGPTAAVRLLRAARELGLQTMLGCYAETSLGISAATHLAALLDCADLDGNLLLAEDPFTGARAAGGLIEPPLGPGLGVALTRSGEALLGQHHA